MKQSAPTVCAALCLVALLASGCSVVNPAKTYMEKFQKKYANPDDACTFLTGRDISIATGDNILSKSQVPRDSSTNATSTGSTQYDCSYNLSATITGFQQGNMEVHMIPPDSYDTVGDRGTVSMTSTETANSGTGNVTGFSGNHDSAYWDSNDGTLYERRNGYAISIKIPFTHSTLTNEDASKSLAKTIFENLPSK